MKRKHPNPHPSAGFSLVEVMVAVVVICVGLLGIAKMQAMALSNTSMSRQRSLAAIEAASFAASMHSNRQYWASFTTPFTVSITGNPAVVTSSDGALQAQTAADLTNLNACIGSNNGAVTCGVASDLAAFDLARWWVKSVSVQLPNPTATVTCPQVPAGNTAPLSCTVQISWTEKSVAVNTAEATQAAAEQANPTLISLSERPVFTLYVEP